MHRIITNEPNASDEIDGIKFELDRGERISEPVSDERAARYADIPGFRIVKVDDAPKPMTAAEKKAAEKAEKAAAEKAAADTSNQAADTGEPKTQE